jgi:phi LC3 family holin
MKLNLKVRIKNPTFWLTLVPAVLLTVQVILAPFGYVWDYTVLNEQLAAIINAVFGVLTGLGVVKPGENSSGYFSAKSPVIRYIAEWADVYAEGAAR